MNALYNRTLFFRWMLLASGWLFLLAACSSQQPIRKPVNFAYRYNPAAHPLEISYQAYNASDEITQVFFQLQTSGLGFLQIKDGPQSYAYIEMKIQVFQEADTLHLLDSMTYQLKIVKQENPIYVSNFPLQLKDGFNYRVQVKSTDRVNQSTDFQVVYVDRNNPESCQNFLVRHTSFLPTFSRIVPSGDTLLVESRFETNDTLYMRFSSAQPVWNNQPFGASRNAGVSFWPDTVFKHPSSHQTKIVLEKEGIYQINTSYSLQSGVQLVATEPHFPAFKTAEAMIGPMKYLLTGREFRDLEKSANPKRALDSLWLSLNPDMARAKELIRIYYNRAETANKLFSLSCEGWASDRGMIYLIFGPPRTVLLAEGEERWIYGDTNLPSLDFIFVKSPDKGFGFDYVLIRQEMYKSSWYQAVDTWRNGRVYSIF